MELKQKLIEDGSNIKDWGKYEIRLPDDDRDLHYYNDITKKVYYDMDYKTKF